MRLAAAVLVALVAFGGVDRRPGTIHVPAGGDLQHALDIAEPGDTVVLDPGAVYEGTFVLPSRAPAPEDTRPITLRTAAPDGDPVPAGERMTPARAPALAKLRSPNRTPALRTAPGARFWRVELLEFLPSTVGNGDVIALGDASRAQRSRDQVPSDLAIDRVYIHADPGRGQKRGIALNSARTTISNSYIAGMKAVGQDAQAIAGWNGPGEYVIENNYLEASGENVLFGGADPSIPSLVPTGIEIRGNTFSKPLRWKGSPWQVKNLLELKNARDVVIEDNVFERNWQAAQSGFAILFTVRNQDGDCPWCQVANVTFRRNVIRDVAAVFQITGHDDNHPSEQTTGIVIRDNRVEGVDTARWGGNGYLLQMTDRPRDVTVDHNTFVQEASSGIAKIDGVVTGFVFTNNVASHGSYGIIGTDHGIGNDSIHAFLPDAVIRDNVIAGGRSDRYPKGNDFPSEEELRATGWQYAGRGARAQGGPDRLR